MSNWPIKIYELGDETPPTGFVVADPGGWIPGVYDSPFRALAAALSVRYHGSPDAADSILREFARKAFAEVTDVADVAEQAPAGGILCASFAFFADADKAQANNSYQRSSTSLRGERAFLESAVDRAVSALWDCKPF